MKVLIRDKATLDSISSLALKSYLLAQGWNTQETITDKAVILAKTGTDKQLLLPIRENLGDYGLRVSELLNTLADFENRSQLSLLDDINRVSFDVIRVRMSENIENDSMPLSTVRDICNEMRNMLLAAACSALEPKKVYGPRKFDEASNYVDKVRMGQTEHGSFVFTFLSPITPKSENISKDLAGEIPEVDPFERMTTKTLLKGIIATKNATSALSKGKMPIKDAEQYGVSANLCDAISNITEKAKTTEFSMTWAKNRPVTNFHTPNAVSFNQDEAKIIANWADTFRKSESYSDSETISRERITGWVYQLQQKDRQDEEGTIHITTTIEGQPKKLKVRLSEQDYAKAVQAHGGRNLISIEADVSRTENKLELKNPGDLAILD